LLPFLSLSLSLSEKRVNSPTQKKRVYLFVQVLVDSPLSAGTTLASTDETPALLSALQLALGSAGTMDSLSETSGSLPAGVSLPDCTDTM
jgi:hypothetical protein